MKIRDMGIQDIIESATGPAVILSAAAWATANPIGAMGAAIIGATASVSFGVTEKHVYRACKYLFPTLDKGEMLTGATNWVLSTSIAAKAVTVLGYPISCTSAFGLSVSPLTLVGKGLLGLATGHLFTPLLVAGTISVALGAYLAYEGEECDRAYLAYEGEECDDDDYEITEARRPEISRKANEALPTPIAQAIFPEVEEIFKGFTSREPDPQEEITKAPKAPRGETEISKKFSIKFRHSQV